MPVSRGVLVDRIVSCTVDIFINCIYLTEKIPYFLTPSFINNAGTNRRLSVIVDVSCDTTNPNNPIPVYGSLSSFTKPVVKASTACVTIDFLD